MQNCDVRNFFLKILSPYKGNVLLILFLMISSSIISFIMPQLTKKIMDEGFIPHKFLAVISIATTMFIFVLFQQLIEYIKEYYRTKIKANLISALYESVFVHICKSKISYLKYNTSELLNQISTDITAISMIVDNTSFFVVTQVFNVIGGVIGLFMIQPEMAIIVIGFVPMKYYFIRYFSKKRTSLSGNLIQNNANFAQWFEDTITGIEEIKLFNLLHIKRDELKPLQKDIVNTDKRVSMLSCYNDILDHILIELIMAVIYIAGAIYVFDASLTIGSVFAFVTYLIYVTAPISAILNIRYMLAGIIPSCYRYLSFFQIPEEKFDGKMVCAKNDGALIEFLDVGFSYGNELFDKKIFSLINFEIYPEEKVAIFGANGSGKSTLIRLLLRLLSPTNGVIKLYDENIENYNLINYREMFSIVSQEVYLFEGSIEYNIALTKEYDSLLLSKAIQFSNLDSLIKKMDTSFIIKKGGKNLSGGQKQKIALARALYRNSDIFVFDEATSNLDIQGKKIFQKLLYTYLKNKTVIIITHEKDLLEMVDRVIYLND